AETGHECDADQELRATGLANMLVAPLGSPPGYAYVSMTSFAHRMGGGGREVGIVAALTLLAGVVTAPWLLLYVPPFVFAGLIVCLGIDFLWSWLVEARARMTRLEWGVVVAITATTALANFLVAIVVGLALSVALFLWEYGRAPVIRRATTLAEARSIVERPAAEDAALDTRGDQVAIVLLQGYLFFGTAERVLGHVRARLRSEHGPPLERLVLDFRHVTGMDSAAVAVLRRLKTLLARHEATLVLTRGGPAVVEAVTRAGDGALPYPGRPLDETLAEAEEATLAAGPVEREDDGVEPLAALLRDVARTERFARGDRLLAAGDPADHVLVIRRGRVEVRAPQDGTRLRVLGAGAVIGDVASYLDAPRTADVIAIEEGEALRLDTKALIALEGSDPALAARIHRALAHALARKIVAANRLLSRTSL
ncbi:MAG: cyclic nucleotide-binding domain-containing protein, partial [Jannaschia sp.]